MAKAIHDAEKHLQRMRNIKKHVDQRIAKAQEDKGTFVLLTGNGKESLALRWVWLPAH